MIENGTLIMNSIKHHKAGISSTCSRCHSRLTPRETEYSVRWFRKALCRRCQNDYTPKVSTPYGVNG